MILILGICSDQVVGQLMQHCLKSDCPFAFVDIERLGDEIDFDDEHWYFPGENPVSHDAFKGVYNRFLNWPSVTQSTQARYLDLFDWLDNRYDNVLNRPKDTMSNLSKPYQLEIAKQFDGWVIPKTNIVMNACVRIESPVVCKSISSERSIVNSVYQRENKSFYEPAILQAYIPGLNIRVHVCDQAVIAVAIQSKQIDYRYSQKPNQIFLYHLPQQIKRDAIALSQVLGLRFTGIDLIYYQGQYYFLEANPSPGYAYFEQALAKPYISQALLNSLSGVVH